MHSILGILLFYLLVFTGEYSRNHPVHLSVTNFEYIDQEDIFSLSVRVFTDDFQAAINKEQNVNIQISERNKNEVKKNIDSYIHNHIKVYFNKKRVFQNTSSQKIMMNTKENTTEIFYKFKHKVPKKVTLENTLFSAYFKDQKNLFIFTCENTQKAFKFDRSNTQSEFSLK